MGCQINKKIQILVLVGSSRKQSVHAGLVDEILRFTNDEHLQIAIHIPVLETLPIFNQDIEQSIILPKSIKKLRDIAAKSDAIMFVTPEINGSLSSLILNAFAWLSRSYNVKGSPLLYKKAGIISASYLSENQIVDCIEIGKHFKMSFLKEPYYLFLGNKVMSEQGKLISSYEKARLQKWYRSFIEFIIMEMDYLKKNKQSI